MKTVYIHLTSNSMGDTIASAPYILEYVKKHNVKVYFNIYDPYIFLLKDSYKEIEFVGRNTIVEYDEKAIEQLKEKIEVARAYYQELLLILNK